MSSTTFPQVAIVYHSGYGHTAVLAEHLARGVRDAGGEPVLLRIEKADQDFSSIIEAVTAADAVVFGTPTYMGDVSGPFKCFADATAAMMMARKWDGKLASGFTNSLSFSGDKLHALTSLVILAAQHGMHWITLGLPPQWVEASERGPNAVNRVGSFLGTAGQSDNAAPEITPPPGDHETARLQGVRIAEAANRWGRRQQVPEVSESAVEAEV